MTLFQILLGVLSLSVLILGHEWGHFVLARRVGVVVERFAVFLGPSLWKKKQGETLYSLGVVPLGGYCKMRAELTDTVRSSPGDFYEVSWRARMLVILAGPAASVLLGLLLFWALNILPHPLPTSYSSRVVVLAEVDGDEGVAFAAGLRDGDRIVSVDGKPVADFAAVAKLRELSKPFVLEFQRGEQTHEVEFAPLSGDGLLGLAPWVEPRFHSVPPSLARQGVKRGDVVVRAGEEEVSNTYRLTEAVRAGATELRLQRGLLVHLTPDTSEDLLHNAPYFVTVERSGFAAPWKAWTGTMADTNRALRLLWDGLRQLFSGRVSLGDSLVGPLRLSELIGTSLTAGRDVVSQWLWVMALVSINLAVVNLLPLPGLDGGAAFVSLLLLLLPRRYWKRGYRIYSWVGAILLFTLLLLVMGLDILHYVGEL